MTKLSLNMIVKDEEKELPRALESVKDIVDEMIIVDTGSKDRTKEIALSYGAKVFDFTWCDDFSAARNCALDHSTGDWILSMDADELVPEHSKKKIISLLQGKKVPHLFRRFHTSEGFIEENTPRIYLFPRDSATRWKYRVHEQITSPAKPKRANIDIYNSRKGAYTEEKLRYYLKLSLSDLASDPLNYNIIYHLAKTFCSLKDYENALLFFDKSIDLIPEDNPMLESAAFYLASSLFFLGRQVEGWVALKNARFIYPKNIWMINLEASLLAKQGKVEEAINLNNEILELSEKYGFDDLGTDPERAKIIATENLTQLKGRTE